ncbi:MAG: hypothetical protein ACT4QD_26560 [Acidobacteriota bacterium]
MRVWPIVALVGVSTASLSAQSPGWSIDVAATAMVEAWNYNESRETLAGVLVGVNRRVWRALSVRLEGMTLRVEQVSDDAWLAGVTAGMRVRWPRPGVQPFVDLAAGWSQATADTPFRGTASNILLVSGGGVAIPIGAVSVDLAARWFHLSNNGSAGRDRNPDIQAAAAVIGIGWGR